VRWWIGICDGPCFPREGGRGHPNGDARRRAKAGPRRAAAGSGREESLINRFRSSRKCRTCVDAPISSDSPDCPNTPQELHGRPRVSTTRKRRTSGSATPKKSGSRVDRGERRRPDSAWTPWNTRAPTSRPGARTTRAWRSSRPAPRPSTVSPNASKQPSATRPASHRRQADQAMFSAVTSAAFSGHRGRHQPGIAWGGKAPVRRQATQ